MLCVSCFSWSIGCVSFVFWVVLFIFFFFKQKTAYEMRISDWSSDVCSSDLDQANALPRTRRRKCHDMLGSVVAKIATALTPKKYARIARQAGAVDFARRRPAGRTIGGDIVRLPGTP